jgi:hypothetical protein
MTSREERMAQNEATSREVNEDVEGMHQVDPPGRRIQIVCECALDGCGRVIAITVTEYQQVRGDPRQFAIVPEHVVGDIERIVSKTTDSPWWPNGRGLRRRGDRGDPATLVQHVPIKARGCSRLTPPRFGSASAGKPTSYEIVARKGEKRMCMSVDDAREH